MCIIPPSMCKWRHKITGIVGSPDDHTTHPDGKILWRVNDQWYFADDFEFVPQ